MNITKHNVAGSGTLGIKQVYLEVIYTSATGVNTTFSLYWLQQDLETNYKTQARDLQGYELGQDLEGSLNARALGMLSGELYQVYEDNARLKSVLVTGYDLAQALDAALAPKGLQIYSFNLFQELETMIVLSFPSVPTIFLAVGIFGLVLSIAGFAVYLISEEKTLTLILGILGFSLAAYSFISGITLSVRVAEVAIIFGLVDAVLWGYYKLEG